MGTLAVLYAWSSELRQIEGKPSPNAYSTKVDEGSVFRDPRNPKQWYVTGKALRESFVFEDNNLRFFVRQQVPNVDGKFMWLLLEDDEQVRVEDNMVQMLVASQDEPPQLWHSAAACWWVDISLSSPSTPSQSSSDQKEDSQRKKKLESRMSGSFAAAQKISAKELQDTLQKTSQEVAASLSGFAKWAKKGLAAASDAMSTTETVKLQSRTVAVRKKLADGGFSEVFLVKCSTTGDEFALKRCLAHSKDDVEDLVREMDLHRKANSDFVMRLVDHAREPSLRVKGAHEVMMLFPLYGSGSIFDQMETALRDNKPWPFPEPAAVHLCLGLLNGLEAIHQAGFVHRDIKPHNVLLSPRKPIHPGASLMEDYLSVTPILMDLGSAGPRRVKIQSRNEAMMAVDEASVKCSAPYRAPELFDIPQIPFLLTEKLDIWSVGTTLFAMTFGRMYSPFEHPTQGLLTLAIHQAKVNFPSSSQYSDKLKTIIKKTLAKDPDGRPSLEQLRNALSALDK